MKLSNETLSILKNFSSISEGLYVPGGSKIRIKESLGKILAEATVTENFPSFCVKDAARFVSILTADKDVSLEFKQADIVISMLGGKSKINYRGSPQSLVAVPKDNDLTIKDPIGTFTFTKDQLDYISKMVGLLGLPCVAIEHKSGKGQLKVFDPKDDSANVQTLEIDLKNATFDFSIILNQETLKFLDGNYTVSLAKGIVQFKHDKLHLTYWVAPELGSSYDQ